MKKISLLVCLFCLSSGTFAERYYVKKDSFGNVDAIKADKQEALPESEEIKRSASSVAQEKNNELIERSSSLDSQPSPPAEVRVDNPAPALTAPVSRVNSQETEEPQPRSAEANSLLGGTISLSTPSEESQIPEETSIGISPISSPVVESVQNEQEVEEPKKPRKLSKFERAFLESEGQNPYDATRIDEADFVDGDELLKGRAVRENERPFFVTKDFDGNESVTFYSPTIAQEQKESGKRKFSRATIFSKEDSSTGAAYKVPESADPLAVKLLSSGGADLSESYFESFAKRCCEKLPRRNIKELILDRSTLLEFSRDMLTFRFSEGDSRYLIVKLPESDNDLALEVRTFIRSYEDLGVGLGVFFPQIVTLSNKFEALRIISDPVLQYSPETWFNYGYLEGVFKIEKQTEKESYILVHTTLNNLRQKSSYEHPTSPISLKHMNTGSLGVKAIPISSVRQ